MIQRVDRSANQISDSFVKTLFYELTESVLIAVVLAVLLRLFIVAPYYIPTPSMVPTLLVNDRIIVNKLVYHFVKPHRGDIVVFKYPLDTSRDFVKRLIAFGGETVTLRDNHLYINGQEVPEKYLPSGIVFSDFGPIKIPEGTYFMLGDNRNDSDDSRVWGMLPARDAIGKVIMIYWPLNQIKFFYN